MTFTPAPSGSRSGAITITDNASDSPESVSLTGTGTAPAVGVTPTSVAFGNQQVGTSSAPQAVTLTDTGSAPLSLTGIAVTGANSGDFAQTNNCGALVAPAASCTINVTFTPTASGARAATLTFSDNATGSLQTISLTGAGTAAAASFTPTSIAFGNQQLNSSSAAQVVTLSNTGSAR